MKPVHVLGLIAPLMAVAAPVSAQRVECARDNGGISVPTGFCATVFADSLPAPRHLRVLTNGDVYVSLMGRGGRGGAAGIPGGVVLLRDSNGDGTADVQLDVVRGFGTSE